MIFAVIGNGNSLKNLTPEQVNNINNADIIYRCNWAFLDDVSGIKKDWDGYFYIAHELDMIKKLHQSNATFKSIYTNHGNIVAFKKYGGNYINIWHRIREIHKHPLSKIHLLPKKIRKVPNIPTTGMLMLLFASLQPHTKIITAGIDFYQDPIKGCHKPFGEYTKNNPFKDIAQPHKLRVDLIFLKDIANRIGKEKIESYSDNFNRELAKINIEINYQI